MDILVVFRLDLGQISIGLVENAFATRQLGLPDTSIVFYDILARTCAEIKIFILNEKVTYILRLFLLFLFVAVIDLLLGLLAIKKLLRMRH